MLARAVLRLWIQADASCGAVTSMLSTAQGPHYFERSDTLYQVWYPRLTFTQWGTVLCDCGEDETHTLDDVFTHHEHVQLIDGERVWAWLAGCAKPLSNVLSHNDIRGTYA